MQDTLAGGMNTSSEGRHTQLDPRASQNCQPTAVGISETFYMNSKRRLTEDDARTMEPSAHIPGLVDTGGNSVSISPSVMNTDDHIGIQGVVGLSKSGSVRYEVYTGDWCWGMDLCFPLDSAFLAGYSEYVC